MCIYAFTSFCACATGMPTELALGSNLSNNGDGAAAPYSYTRIGYSKLL